jgi:hypothetical protein
MIRKKNRFDDHENKKVRGVFLLRLEELSRRAHAVDMNMTRHLHLNN